MTTTEFKKKYPQHSHLEGDALWDEMTLSLLNNDNVLTADPNREIIYHEPITLPNGISVSIEDSSTTRWLNSKGEEVKVKPEKRVVDNVAESYRMEIVDFGKL